MIKNLSNKEIVKGIRRLSKRLDVLASDFEHHPRKTRNAINSVTLTIKFNEEHFFPKITKL